MDEKNIVNANEEKISQIELLVINPLYEAESVIDAYESLIWTDRYYEYGDFEIYLPATNDNLEKFHQDDYLCIEGTEHMMIVEEISVSTDVDDGNHLTIAGRSLESILERRIIWEQTVLDGYLEGQIEKLLNQNIISPSDPGRKIDNFVFRKSGNTAIESLKIVAQFTGDNLYDAIHDICLSCNIGFKITLNELNQFVFQLYAGDDHSYDQLINPVVVFSSDFGNILDSNYMESKKPLKTIALVAGEGEGSDRKTVTVGSSTISGLNRRELYVDARDISSQTETGTIPIEEYNAQLSQRGTENLAQNQAIQSFDGRVEPTQLYIYGKDYFMGDIAQMENEYGMTAKIRVTEYIRSISVSGTEYYPTFETVE